MEYSYMISLAVVAIVSLPALGKQVSFALKVYSLFLLLSVVIESVAFYLSRKKIETQWLYNWLMLFEYPATIFIFYSYTSKKTLKTIVLLSGVTYFIFSLLNHSYFESDPNRFHTNIVIIGGSLVILLAILYYTQIYSSQDTNKLVDDPIFWVSSSVIIGYAPMVPFYGMLNYLTDNYQNFAYIYLIYIMNIFFILSYVCTMIAYLKLYKFPSTLNSQLT